MKSAREAEARALAHEILGNPCRGLAPGHHSVECDRATAAIESRDREHAEEVERLRAELAEAKDQLARTSGERARRSEASLATIAADRDAARSDLAEARTENAALIRSYTKRLGEASAAYGRLVDELAASVRREEESAEIEKALRRALDASAGIADVARWLSMVAHMRCGTAAEMLADGSWIKDKEAGEKHFAETGHSFKVPVLRDLATMDGRPAEAKHDEVLCGCGDGTEASRRGHDPKKTDLGPCWDCKGMRAARPANKETDNG